MAIHCLHCKNALFDYLYGLPEESEIQEMREHLRDCLECQTALEQVQAQRNLMARAARAIQEVPEFSIPADELVTLPQASEMEVESPAEQPALAQAASASAAPRRPLWRRPLIAWVTAAAILLAVGASISLYRSTLHGYENQLTVHRQETRKVEREIAALPAKYDGLQKAALEKLRAQELLHLHVDGPTQIQPGAKANLNIVARQADGEFAKCEVAVRVVEEKNDKVVQEVHLAGAGPLLAQIDATKAKPHAKLKIVVEAKTKTGAANVQENVTVTEPSYVTRIDTNKLAYHLRDVLFFRVLVLNRQDFTPPSQPILLRLTLVNPTQAVIRQWMMWTNGGGILAGELPIEDHFPAGNYTLHVGAFDGTQAGWPVVGASVAGLTGQGSLLAAGTLFPGRIEQAPVQSVARHLEVVRKQQQPNIQFDQDQYALGQKVTGFIYNAAAVPQAATASFGTKIVPVTIDPQPHAQGGLMPTPMAPLTSASSPTPGGMGGGASGMGAFSPNMAMARADAEKRPLRFQTAIPKDLQVKPGANKLPFAIQMQNGNRKEEFKANLPLSPTDYAVDFFPEGGELIAGVANRVFYRVRSQSGEPVTGEGSVILMSAQNDIVDSRYQLGMGFFDFTPSLKETYTVRVTSPVKTNIVAHPFARLGIRSSGMVLHVASAVGKQGEPIAVTVRVQGPRRELMMVAQCRGQIVDQQWVNVKAGTQEIVLRPTSDAHGMIRVTAYAAMNGVLEPLAERLVYRAASKKLDLGVAFDTRQYQPGAKMQGKLAARDEKGRSVPAWLLVSVVDERFQPRPRSLSAYFFLLNEIRAGADLDNAQLVLHDAPESASTLELFLGTHGWRRFARTQEPAQHFAAAPGAAPTVFSRENMPLEALRQNDEERRLAVLTPLRRNAHLEQMELREELLHQNEALMAVLGLRFRFEEQVRTWIGLSLGITLALLLGVSVTLMGIGAYRIVRRHKSATFAFGGAFACLAVCLLMKFAGASIVPPEITRPKSSDLSALEPSNRWNEVLGQVKPLRTRQEPPPAGTFAMLGIRGTQTRRDNEQLEEKQDRVARLASSTDLAKLHAERDEGAANAMQANVANPPNLKMMYRWQQARAALGGAGHASEKQLPDAKHPTPPAAVLFSGKKNKGDMGGFAEADGGPDAADASKERGLRLREKEMIDRQYAYEYAPNLKADTLLWSPMLWLADGSGEIRFDLASGQATYRVLILGHTPTGQFGHCETRIDVPEVGR